MSNNNVRRVTNDVISAVEDGFLSWKEVAKACLNYMSEDDVKEMVRVNDWAIDDEDYEEPDDEDEQDSDDLAEYEERSFISTLSDRDFELIDEIIEPYNTSIPVSGKWETEAIHERDTIMNALNCSKEQANEVMIDYLGFEIEDLNEDYSNNNEDNQEDDLENKLVGNNDYSDLNFYQEGELVGNIDLEYDELEVMDQFDNDIIVGHTYTVYITPDIVLDYICNVSGLNRRTLTVGQAQELIDELAIEPEPFYEYLREQFVDEATEEAQEEVATGDYF